MIEVIVILSLLAIIIGLARRIDTLASDKKDLEQDLYKWQCIPEQRNYDRETIAVLRGLARHHATHKRYINDEMKRREN